MNRRRRRRRGLLPPPTAPRSGPSWRPGDRSRGICGGCQALRDTVAVRRPFPLAGSSVAPLVLVFACTICGATVSIPHSETPRIRSARRAARRAEAVERCRPSP